MELCPEKRRKGTAIFQRSFMPPGLIQEPEDFFCHVTSIQLVILHLMSFAKQGERVKRKMSNQHISSLSALAQLFLPLTHQLYVLLPAGGQSCKTPSPCMICQILQLSSSLLVTTSSQHLPRNTDLAAMCKMREQQPWVIPSVPDYLSSILGLRITSAEVPCFGSCPPWSPFFLIWPSLEHSLSMISRAVQNHFCGYQTFPFHFFISVYTQEVSIPESSGYFFFEN